MQIRVLCSDKHCGFVEDYYLDGLISRGVVAAFFRPSSNEWVNPQHGRIRKKTKIGYKGPERRAITKGPFPYTKDITPPNSGN
jgi:hypothetical protein